VSYFAFTHTDEDGKSNYIPYAKGFDQDEEISTRMAYRLACLSLEKEDWDFCLMEAFLRGISDHMLYSLSSISP
jgi:hypothetical protein